MQPLDSKLREALKGAHPGLTDEDIDLSDALLVRQQLFDPGTERAQIEKLDQERAALIRRKMPGYAAIVQAFTHAGARARPKPTATIIVKERTRR